MRRRSFDSGEIKRAADGGASIDCCCNYNAILAQSQMKLFRIEPTMDANVLLQLLQANADVYILDHTRLMRVCVALLLGY